MTLILSGVIFGLMLIEAQRARRNERVQRARGGIEPVSDAAVYAVMRVAYPAAFASMLLERTARGAPPSDLFVIGAAVFVAAKALKWWAILELGPAWTFKVIVVPGARLVTTGPYRYVRHPNYLGVFGELVGTGLMSGAAVAGPVATLIFTALMFRRAVVEQRALDAPSARRAV